MRNLLLDLLRSRKQTGTQPAVVRVRDGFWWRKLTESGRLAYVVGFLDALRVGRAAAAVAWAGDTAYPWEESELEVARVTVALDEFFGNPHNSRMALPSAMYYVVKSLENPTADYSELLRRLRESPPSTSV